MHAVSDPIPHVFGGALLDIRSVAVKLDRPTSRSTRPTARPSPPSGTLQRRRRQPGRPGGLQLVRRLRARSRSAAARTSASSRSCSCGPSAARKRAQEPEAARVLVARAGDANIAPRRVTLPNPLILEQASIGNVCTRVQFAAHDCPADSIYGFAEATTPLLDGPLKGPVYLRSTPNHELPDLRRRPARPGRRRASTASSTATRGRLRTTFDTVPDVPVSKFVLTIKGGKKRACWSTPATSAATSIFSRLELKGQNGAQLLKKKLRVRADLQAKQAPQAPGTPHGSRD